MVRIDVKKASHISVQLCCSFRCILQVEERMDLLGRIKAFVDTIDHCSLAKDVSMLLDRELQMLHRGTDLGQEYMEGMRKRLSNQFTKLVIRLNSDARNGAGYHA